MCATPFGSDMKALTSISDRDAGGAAVKESNGILIALIQKQIESGFFERVPMLFIRVNPFLDWIKKTSGIDFPKRRKRDLSVMNDTMITPESTLVVKTTSDVSTTTTASLQTFSEHSKRTKKSKKPKKSKKSKKPKMDSKKSLKSDSTNSSTYRDIRVQLTIGDRHIDVQNGQHKNVSLQFDDEDTVLVDID